MTFGDTEPADAFDASEPDADPEAVARRYHELRDDPNLPRWDQLTAEERARAVEIFVRLARWLRDQGARL